MDNSVIIRKATPADLDGILEVEKTSFDCDWFSRRQFAYLISHAKGMFYVAEYDKRIVGYISLLHSSKSKSIRIYSIAVHPEARGHRLGQRLMDISKEYAKECNLKQISLEVRVDNIAAINLYRRNGFLATSII